MFETPQAGEMRLSDADSSGRRGGGCGGGVEQKRAGLHVKDRCELTTVTQTLYSALSHCIHTHMHTHMHTIIVNNWAGQR